MATTDAEALLVRQVRAGDAEAWRQLIERFEGRLLAFVDSRLRDRAASEDVVQETFVGFLTSLPHYDEKRDMEAYLFSIAAHKLTDHLRKQGRRPIDQFGSDDHGRPLDEVPGGGPRRRRASPAAASAARPRSGCSPSRWASSSASGSPGATYDRLRCLELLIVKGWANKDVAKYLGPDRAGGGQLQVPDHRPAQGDGPPGRAEPRTNWARAERDVPDRSRPRRPESDPIDDEMLRRYLADDAAPRGLWPGSRRPCATRPSFAPGSRTSARTASDVRLHTLGAIWRRGPPHLPDPPAARQLPARRPRPRAGRVHHSSTSTSSSVRSARPTSPT